MYRLKQLKTFSKREEAIQMSRQIKCAIVAQVSKLNRDGKPFLAWVADTPNAIIANAMEDNMTIGQHDNLSFVQDWI